MAAFSFQQHTTLDPAVFFSNIHDNPTPNANLFFPPQFYQPAAQGILISSNNNNYMDFGCSVHHQSSSSHEPSVSNKQSPAASSSVVLDQKHEIGDNQVTQKCLIDKKRKYKNGSCLDSAQSKQVMMIKGKTQKKRAIQDKEAKQNKQVVEEVAEASPPTGYIHVRARRGQATDSHSLAERVRREKISERMKLLQALVPGCDKVTGKALMLDEIINYVQSLQNQVEFLSMKLASVNPMFYDFGMDLDAFMVKPDHHQSLSSLEPQVEQCRPNNNYPLLDSSSATSLALQQAHVSNYILSQGNGYALWGVDDQRQKFINQSTLSNNLSSFH